VLGLTCNEIGKAIGTFYGNCVSHCFVFDGFSERPRSVVVSTLWRESG
jgi:hypothetical protein